MIEEDLYSHLSTCAGLTALVGTRVYPLMAPQKVTPPYCVYFKVSSVREYSHGGFSGLQRSRIQISCYGKTYPSVKAVAVQVIAAIESWQGVNVSVQSALPEDEIDIYHDESELFHTAIDFFAWYG